MISAASTNNRSSGRYQAGSRDAAGGSPIVPPAGGMCPLPGRRLLIPGLSGGPPWPVSPAPPPQEEEEPEAERPHHYGDRSKRLAGCDGVALLHWMEAG